MTAISDHHYRKSDRYMIGMVLMGLSVAYCLSCSFAEEKTKSGENLLLKNATFMLSHRALESRNKNLGLGKMNYFD